MKKIGLKYNQLKMIPQSLSKCVELEEFNIENNNIENIPQEVFENCVELRHVNIARNKFQSLPQMKGKGA